MGISAKRILIVDDDPLVRDSVSLMLTTEGYIVETAIDAKAALDVFKKGKFDLVLLDYEMPGTNGNELAVALKALDLNQPIAMVTAYPEMLAASGTPLVGVDLLISKPFDLQQVHDAVAKLLRKS
jgi:DNA-binding response OmpR family regulator